MKNDPYFYTIRDRIYHEIWEQESLFFLLKDADYPFGLGEKWKISKKSSDNNRQDK